MGLDRPTLPRSGSAVGAVILLFVGLFAGLAAAKLLTRPAEPRPVEVRPLTFSGADREPAISPDGKTLVFTSVRDGRPRLWSRPLPEGVPHVLTEGPDSSARFTADGTSLLFVHHEGSSAVIHRVPLVGGPSHEVINDAYEVDGAPDGHGLAFLRESATGSSLWFSRPDGDDAREIYVTQGRRLGGVRWAPRGSAIAVTSCAGTGLADCEIVVVDARTGSARSLPGAGTPVALSAVAWSDRGRSVVFAEGSREGAPTRIVRQRIDTGEMRALAALDDLFGDRALVSLEIAAAGTVVVDHAYRRWRLIEIGIDASPGTRGRRLAESRGVDFRPAYSLDGNTVYVDSNRAGVLERWGLDLDSGAQRRRSDDHPLEPDTSITPDGGQVVPSEIGIRPGGYFGRSRSTPDGKRLVFSAGDAPDRLDLFVQDFLPGRDTEGTPRRLTDYRGEGVPTSFAVSPDGRRVVVSVLDSSDGILIAENVPRIPSPRGAIP